MENLFGMAESEEPAIPLKRKLKYMAPKRTKIQKPTQVASILEKSAAQQCQCTPGKHKIIGLANDLNNIWYCTDCEKMWKDNAGEDDWRDL